ncbi:MAG TPA: aminotransferase class I/II-fold pyridoxal phosphate-dependent enzyme [Candidatus Dormibacteraeota bacterium]|jgi:aspartate/methionine/tyrosine aminotransferase|nr:aminotransferase class I/II-fold pyridoxal phosphate-dependent enzyme [Candidatus Dormibacteraeota bacterium]
MTEQIVESRLPTPARIERLALPERAADLGMSVRDAEHELERAPSPGELLDLTYANTHRFPAPAWVLPAINEAAAGRGMTYTPYRGDATVRSAVAESLSTFLGVPVDPEGELILTPGSQAGLFVALSSLVVPGGRVALIDPDYLSSERLLRYLGAEVTPIPLRWEDSGQPPSPDLEAMEAAFRGGVRLLLFSHPNNPTGMVYGPAVIAAIARLAREFDVVVVADELYSRLTYEETAFSHLLAEPGMRERCVTLLGPSKTESMSGYRLGVAVGPPEVIDRMEDVLGVSVLRAPAYAQHALVPWLAADHEFVRDRIVEYRTLRDTTVERLRHSPLIEVRPALGTAYMFPDVSLVGATDQEVALALKREAGMLINPGYQFGRRGTGHFRLCFAQTETAWEPALERMVATLERLHERGAGR